MPKKQIHRLDIRIEESELAILEALQGARGVTSRQEIIRDLLHKALAADGHVFAEQATPRGNAEATMSETRH